MTAKSKIGGVWKDVSGIHAKVGGTWKAVSEGYTRIGGVWKQFYGGEGLAWSAANVDTTRGFANGTHYSGTTYLFNVNNSAGWYLVDASDWTTTNRASQTYSNQARSIHAADDGTVLFAVGQYAYRSTDAFVTNATQIQDFSNGAFNLGTNKTGLWLGAVTNDYRYSSNNGTSWTTVSNVFGSLTVWLVDYSPPTSKWLAIDDGVTTYYTSASGTGSWTARTLPFTPHSQVGQHDIQSTSNNFYLKSTTTYDIWRTSDGISWTDTNRPAFDQLTSLTQARGAAVGNQVVTVGYYNTGAGNPADFQAFIYDELADTWTALPFADGLTYSVSNYSAVQLFSNGVDQVVLAISTTDNQTHRMKVDL